jgi:hypothetical protein
MAHTETLIVTTTKANKCERCADDIAVGEHVVFYKSTKTVSHLSCHLKAARARS